MKNTRSVSSYVLAGIGIGTIAWLTLKPGNTKVNELMSTVKSKVFPSKQLAVTPIEKAGYSDPHDLDDNKMVSEGSMYGVHYYNEKEQ